MDIVSIKKETNKNIVKLLLTGKEYTFSVFEKGDNNKALQMYFLGRNTKEYKKVVFKVFRITKPIKVIKNKDEIRNMQFMSDNIIFTDEEGITWIVPNSTGNTLVHRNSG